MILADKIIELRKKNGWSQEELAEKLGVSRQSISKWEGAQSLPDMNRIIKMSELFGVSTDILLRDELVLEPSTIHTEELVPDSSLTNVSVEEANTFLEYRVKASGRIALGVMMCILSPIMLIIMAAAQENEILNIPEPRVAGLGLISLFLLVGGAVALFISTGIAGDRFEYLEHNNLDTAYGVDGIVRERRERFRDTYTRMLTLGIVLCVVSVLPIAVTLILRGEEDFAMALAAAGLLTSVAVGVFLIVRASIVWSSFQVLLEENDYSRSVKNEKRSSKPLSRIYWALVCAAYLAYSFITRDWQRSWIIWPVAGVAYGAVSGIVLALRKKT
ncbi:MAG TPA: helix-turn-helix transcriptional regulator [Bacillota bacterium]|nr:helix-turn-helix transcriptional regulator [Bacillota bacterium]